MECEALMLDDFDSLEDRQDLSQYSYDPEDRLETVTFPDSQQSSQASDKTDVFLGVFDDQKPADSCDGEDVQPFMDSNKFETEPLMSEDTDEREYLCSTGATGWLTNTDEVSQLTQVSVSQQVPSLLWLEDQCQQTFEVQVRYWKQNLIYCHFSFNFCWNMLRRNFGLKVGY